MNIKYFSYLFLGVVFCVLFSSCNNDDNTVEYTSDSKDAQIYSFALTAEAPISKDSLQRAQDSIRFIQVNKTQYSINQIDGLIYNPDSLQFGTKLKKALITVGFNPSYGVSKIQVFTPDSIKGYVWNTTDSIDFSKQPVKLLITARDGTTKNYDIDIRIHKVDPEVMIWNEMSSLPVAGESKTLLRNDNEFYAYTNSNGVVSLHTTQKNTIVWLKETLTGLPSDVKIESLTLLNDVFYAIDKIGDSYSSTNGKQWVKQTNNLVIESILGVLPSLNGNASENSLLAIVKKDNTYYFGQGSDLLSMKIIQNVNGYSENLVPVNFPIKGMASTTSFSTSRSERMLILTAGQDKVNTILDNTWLIKYSGSELEITSFLKKPLFTGGVGFSTFFYDDLLYILTKNQFYTSLNWGELWVKAPSQQKLPSQTTTGQTTIVDSQKDLWIFGGVSAQGTYSKQVWKGRLNRLNP